MTEDDVMQRTVGILKALHDLKEDMLFFRFGVQPEFDAGMLEAAMSILAANADDEHPLMKAERARQLNARLLRALESSKTVDAVGQRSDNPI